MKITAVLADDHAIMRDGLRLILQDLPEVEIVGEASNGRDAVELATRLNPQIVIMDVGMSDLNGLEATRRIKAAAPSVHVIALSAYADRRYVLGMLQAGASGYVHKSTAGRELIQAVVAVCAGRRYLGAEVAGIVVDDWAASRSTAGSPGVQLTPREREVLQMLAEGKTSKQIAACLHASVKTVETHRQNLMKKLDLHNLADLTKYAIVEGLIQLE